MNTIYALVDPATDSPRYVGKTRNIHSRYQSHCYSKSFTHCSRWIQKIRDDDGRFPVMMILESGLSEQDWPEAEQFWIAYFKFIGASLTNITNGGHHIVMNPSGLRPTRPTRPPNAIPDGWRRVQGDIIVNLFPELGYFNWTYSKGEEWERRHRSLTNEWLRFIRNNPKKRGYVSNERRLAPWERSRGWFHKSLADRGKAK